jgi:hypothetical protein
MNNFEPTPTQINHASLLLQRARRVGVLAGAAYDRSLSARPSIIGDAAPANASNLPSSKIEQVADNLQQAATQAIETTGDRLRQQEHELQQLRQSDLELMAIDRALYGELSQPAPTPKQAASNVIDVTPIEPTPVS